MNDVAQLTIRAAAAADAERIASLFTDEGYPAGPSDIVDRLSASRAGRAASSWRSRPTRSSDSSHSHARTPVRARRWFIRVVAVVVDPGERERGHRKALIAEVERVARDEGAEFARGDGRPPSPGCASAVRVASGYDATVTAYLRKRV